MKSIPSALSLSLLFLLGSLTWILPVSPAFGSGPDTTLWDRAARADKENACQIPGLIIVSEEITDTSGNRVEQSTTRFRVTQGADTALDADLVSCIYNDRDETRAAAREFSKDKASFIAALEQDSLFSQTRRPDITLIRFIPGETTSDYLFHLAAEGRVLEGRITLDNHTAVPVRLVLSADELKDEDALITAFREETRYEKTETGWQAGTVVQTMGIETKGFLTGFKGNLTETTTFQDYFCHEAR